VYPGAASDSSAHRPSHPPSTGSVTPLT
jgi:hypothetical protein